MLTDYKINVTANGLDYIFPVEIERKKRRQLILRVYPKTGRILLSLPVNTPESYARQFLETRRRWLEGQALNMLSLPPAHEYRTGEMFYHLGRALTLTTASGRANRAELADGGILLQYKEPLDKPACQRALERLFTGLAGTAVEQSLNRMLPVYSALIPIVRPPAVKLRRMVSRWGVCRPRRGEICFSTRLAHVAPELVDYVVAHELCHLKIGDHSPRFWQLLEQGMPDWRNFRRELAKTDTSIDI